MFAALGAVPRVARDSELPVLGDLDRPPDLRPFAIPNNNDTAAWGWSRQTTSDGAAGAGMPAAPLTSRRGT